MKLVLIALLFGALAVSSASATTQIPDYIIYEGKTYRLDRFPMVAYFAKHPDRKPKHGMVSTALWRGYVATLEVKSDRLILQDVQIELRTPSGPKLRSAWKSIVNEVIPKGQTLEIDWLTGVLLLRSDWRKRGTKNAIIPEKHPYILLEVRSGKITDRKHLDHAAYNRFRKRHFEAFKKTEAYRKELATRLKRGRSSRESIDSLIEWKIHWFITEFLDDEPATGGTPHSDEKSRDQGKSSDSYVRSQDRIYAGAAAARRFCPGTNLRGEAFPA